MKRGAGKHIAVSAQQDERQENQGTEERVEEEDGDDSIVAKSLFLEGVIASE